METRKIQLKTLAAAIIGILIIELAGSTIDIPEVSSLSMTGMIRILELAVLSGLVLFFEGSLIPVGISSASAVRGLKRGAIWSMLFGVAVCLVALALFAADINPITFVKPRLPDNSRTLLLLFLVGGCIAPVAEELFFRGIVYTYFRRYGMVAALVISTTIFASLHSYAGIPFIQLIGGILFSIAFEVEKNLFVPIIIHVLANLAIFSTSFLTI
jgi:membrane protease YdiL (CAAX protease family)